MHRQRNLIEARRLVNGAAALVIPSPKRRSRAWVWLTRPKHSEIHDYGTSVLTLMVYEWLRHIGWAS